jgi:hypothetical protein
MDAGSSGADTAVTTTTAVTNADSAASSHGTTASSRVPAQSSSSDGDLSATSPTTTDFLPGVPTISPADLADMANFGDTVEQVDIADSAVMDKVHVSAKDAVAAATGDLGFLSKGSLESVTLAYFTDATYGIPNDADPSGEGNGKSSGGVTPLIAHRLVWLVIVSDFPMAIGGGPGPDGSSDDPPPMTVPADENRMWVAVDASSGKALLASSIVHGD